MKHLSDNNFNTNKLQNVPNPSSSGDAVNKAYVDTNLQDGLESKIDGDGIARIAVSASEPTGLVDGDLWIDDTDSGYPGDSYLTAQSNLSDLSDVPTAKMNLGIGNVDNTSDLDKPVSTATQSAISAHAADKNNPHEVTKAQVGLSNADNTSDADKQTAFLAAAYPVGSLYINRTNSTSPAVLFGVGTWMQITDKMIMARGSTYTADGGAASHTHGLNDGFAKIASSGAVIVNNTKSASYPYNQRRDSVGATGSTGSTTLGTELGGSTDSSSNIPPMIVAYVWERTA